MNNMEQKAKSDDRIDFVVGSELKLNDILSDSDVIPLLKTIVKAGAETTIIMNEKKEILWAEGIMSEQIRDLKIAPRNSKLETLYHEGEPIGYLLITIPDSADEKYLAALVKVALTGFDTIIKNTTKRILATELHTNVVQQSYKDLLETNKRLSESESRYRELAQTLEQKVEERTAELKNAYARLLQQEKMASVGQLAAGIAHEINNPLGFIHSNLNTFGNYFKKLREILEFYKSKNQKSGLKIKEAEDIYRKLNIDFIMGDIPELIRQSIEGTERVRKIISDLKGFSHIDDAQETFVDINAEIDKTISVLSHESKDRADFVRNYGDLPSFFCNPGLICQVFLNIILNAIQVSKRPVLIKITTYSDGRFIIIAIEDNGPGIPENIIGRIFEPFFTTKDVGKGSGLGLTVSYDIVKTHGGDIEVNSPQGKGTTFTISLPVKGEKHG